MQVRCTQGARLQVKEISVRVQVHLRKSSLQKPQAPKLKVKGEVTAVA